MTDAITSSSRAPASAANARRRAIRFHWITATLDAADESWVLVVASALQRAGHDVAITAPEGSMLLAEGRDAGWELEPVRGARWFDPRGVWRARSGARLGAADVAIAWGESALARALRRVNGETVLFAVRTAADSRRPAAAARVARWWALPGATSGQMASLPDAVAVPASVPDRAAERRVLRLPRRTVLALHVAPLAAGHEHGAILEGLAELRRRGVEPPTVAFLGTGPLESDLHVRCQDLGVKDQVLWIGFRRDWRPYVAAADGVLLPRGGAESKALRLHAEASGGVVIAPDPGSTGASWADALSALLAAERREILGRDARARVQRTADASDAAAELECALWTERLARSGFARTRPALFLDRDGTLVRNVPYNADAAAVVLEPRVARALRWARAAGFLPVVVSNQSAVARGRCTLAEVQAVNERIGALLREEGAAVESFYICPHHPDYGGACDCRKPAPGLLLRAAGDLSLDLGRSVLVGDSGRDLEAARRAGVTAVAYRNPDASPTDDPIPAGVPAWSNWLVLMREVLRTAANA